MWIERRVEVLKARRKRSEHKLNQTKNVSKGLINIYDFLKLVMITAWASEVSLLRILVGFLICFTI